jgi:AP-2 complex subunit sigma-1
VLPFGPIRNYIEVFVDCMFLFVQVYQMVDEFYLAGEVQETSKQVVMSRMAELETLD